MHKSVKILAQVISGHWVVWFEDAERVRFVEKTIERAIDKLLAYYGTERFLRHLLEPVGDAPSETNAEFLIPLRNHRTIPSPSLN